MSEQRTDQKAGWCANCRAETHGLCASVTCVCPSKGRRNHPLRKQIVLHHVNDDPVNITADEAQAVRDELTIALVAENEHRVIRGEL